MGVLLELLRTGKIPVPHRLNFIVAWAGGPVKNGQDARSTKSKFSGGVGILTAHERFIDNGAISQFVLAYLHNFAVNFTEFDFSSQRQS